LPCIGTPPKSFESYNQSEAVIAKNSHRKHPLRFESYNQSEAVIANITKNLLRYLAILLANLPPFYFPVNDSIRQAPFSEAFN
jgi:hypothetical protein